MIWIGKAGSSALAAVGTAGLFTWLAEAFYTLPKLGATIRVAQSVGHKDYEKTKHYITSALQLTIALAFLYGMILVAFNHPLISFFRLGDEGINEMARNYLVTAGIGMLFYFAGPVFTGIFTGLGDSKTPFIVNTIGLVLNIILDPLLIFGIGGFSGLGRTYLPNMIVIVLTALRIPLAILLSGPLGLDGVWWSISSSSITKGIILVGAYVVLSKTGRLVRNKIEQFA